MLLYWNRCYSLALKGWPLALQSDSHFKALLQKKKKGVPFILYPPSPTLPSLLRFQKCFCSCAENQIGELLQVKANMLLSG